MALSPKSKSGQEVTFDDASMLKQLSNNNTTSLDSADDSKVVDENDIVTLQIGERTFNTYKSTLCKSPYFKAMLSDKFRDRRSDGSYFIDRNGNHFAYLLDFLRCGYVEIPKEIVQTIQMEAHYFQIQMDFSELSRVMNCRQVSVSEGEIKGGKREKKRKDRQSYRIERIKALTIISSMAAMLANIASCTVTHPLDLIRTRLYFKYYNYDAN